MTRYPGSPSVSRRFCAVTYISAGAAVAATVAGGGEDAEDDFFSFGKKEGMCAGLEVGGDAGGGNERWDDSCTDQYKNSWRG